MSIPFALDVRALLQVQAALSFATAAFHNPSYNLALFLFGVYAVDQTTLNEPLRLFAGMLAVSLVWDLIWMIRNSQAILVRLISILILILKVPTLSTTVASLRQRGDYLASRLGTGDLGGSTIWTMPGGFTRQAGYDSLDSGEAAGPYADTSAGPADVSRIPQVVNAPRPPPPQSRPQPPSGAAPGAYESV
ncbi:hypothetical protein CALVIDRAFT_540001 [Calocera viscosa TUFC12733]|uniref:Uncharacterized protein n=1 Tax=Calocera viscosa (strain TUFC12733) TaxID=1330018 RepID=A0A167JFV4_CALVF|nr:hypothetical protein CALVIDRAFT_540001 [Calocera viscosa TUFC12733]